MLIKTMDRFIEACEPFPLVVQPAVTAFEKRYARITQVRSFASFFLSKCFVRRINAFDMVDYQYVYERSETSKQERWEIQIFNFDYIKIFINQAECH